MDPTWLNNLSSMGNANSQPTWINQGLSYQPQTTNTGGGWNTPNMIGMGAQALTGLIGSGINAWLGSQQLKLANKQMEAQEAQRKVENERYQAQLDRLNKATNDAVSTASALKSATAQVATTTDMGGTPKGNEATTNMGGVPKGNEALGRENIKETNLENGRVQGEGVQKTNAQSQTASQANAQKQQAKASQAQAKETAKELPMQRE